MTRRQLWHTRRAGERKGKGQGKGRRQVRQQIEMHEVWKINYAGEEYKLIKYKKQQHHHKTEAARECETEGWNRGG